MKKLKRFFEYILVFLSTGSIYFLIECIYKQRLSHWSMFVLSGFVGLIAMLLNDIFTYDMDFLLQIFICTAITTAFEYLVGITLNFDYSIWDYRGLKFQLDGQISLLFSFIWALLFTFLIPILDYVEWKIFKYQPNNSPYYKVFGKEIFRM